MTGADLKRQFGLRVQRLRRQQKLTQEQLAERIERSTDTVSNIERGFSSTRLETALSIAEALGATLPELFESDEITDADPDRRRVVERLLRLLRQEDLATIAAIAEIAEITINLRREKVPSRR